jgi:hypothetical protein
MTGVGVPTGVGDSVGGGRVGVRVIVGVGEMDGVSERVGDGGTGVSANTRRPPA